MCVYDVDLFKYTDLMHFRKITYLFLEETEVAV